MRIASISKPITMAAVAKAMEAGVLDLDKPVQAYVPKFPEKTVDGEKVSKYLYTTHGWTLIAAVLEGATKRKFPDIIRKLFKDLGLDTRYLDDHQPLIYNRSRYYMRDKNSLLVNAPYVDCSYKYAGGGMLSTAPDLVRVWGLQLWPGSPTPMWVSRTGD
nr:hypothetical protein BaRGS_015227 [Batillaria attramentaria]